MQPKWDFLRYDQAVDIEKTMQFVLEQQAKFFAGMEEMREEMRGQREQLREYLGEQGKTNMALGKAMLGLTDHIDRLTAAQAATDRQLKELGASVAELRAAQAGTDERLNALIGVVDGLVRRPST